jgi:hypothetical protein
MGSRPNIAEHPACHRSSPPTPPATAAHHIDGEADMKFVPRATAALALSAALVSQAGVLEIDQSLVSAYFQIQFHAPYAQSFSVAGTQLETISVLAVDMNGFGDYLLDRDITLHLHAGSGVAGPVLASRTLDAAGLIGTSSEAWLSFGLGGLPVQPGAAYTFALQVATPRFGTGLQQDDPYTGGRAFFVDPQSGAGFGSEYDLSFRVTTVPEPHAAGLLFAGLCLLALAAARRGRPS